LVSEVGIIIVSESLKVVLMLVVVDAFVLFVLFVELVPFKLVVFVLFALESVVLKS
jgi:hypothetical protein